MTGAQQVYFARCIGPHGTSIGAVKVGCSYGHKNRLVAVARTQPYTLELITAVPGGMITEAAVHLHLQKHRIDGEFFHENAIVMDYIQAVAERGTAFYWLDTSVYDGPLHPKAFEAFLAFHGITLSDVCKFINRDPKQYLDKLDGMKNRKLIAASALYASQQTPRRFVNWPIDCIRGLLGEVHPHVRPQITQLKEAA